jgi:hypothetical protein
MLLPPELVTCTHLEGMHSLWYNENKPKGYSNVPHVKVRGLPVVVHYIK